MKRAVAIAFILIGIASLVYYFWDVFNYSIYRLSSPIPSLPFQPSVTPIQENAARHEIEFQNKTYEFFFHKIAAGETLDLIPNFQESTFSAQIVKNNNCSFGINAGFYKKEGGPLGLFFTEQKVYGEKILSTTFNGFFSLAAHPRESGDPGFGFSISSFPADDSSQYKFIFQTGPLIFLKNEVQPNFIEEDFSRRHLIAKSTNGDFFLFSIFEKGNVFNGPRLKDLREIFLVSEFTQISDFELLLNLDGGSASAFYDDGVQVEEFKPIGSFLCGKNKLAK